MSTKKYTYVKEPCCDMGRLRARQNNVTQNMIKRTFQSASSTESCGRFHTHGNWAVILSINKWFCSSSRIASSISWSISIWSADCMTVLGSGADCAVAVAPCCILSLAAVACVQGTASNRVYFSFSYSFLTIKIRLKSMKTVIVIMWSYFFSVRKSCFSSYAFKCLHFFFFQKSHCRINPRSVASPCSVQSKLCTVLHWASKIPGW